MTSMQATICSLSVSLENARRELESFKRNFSSFGKIPLNHIQIDSPDPKRYETNLSSHEFISRESSNHKIIEDANSASPMKTSNQDFKLILKEKL